MPTPQTAEATVALAINKANLIRYAELKIQISQLENEMELLKDSCLKDILELRGESDSPIELTELPGYKFSIMKRKTWTYSPLVQDLEARYKEQKKLEEQNGDATFTEKPSLIFSSPKES